MKERHFILIIVFFISPFTILGQDTGSGKTEDQPVWSPWDGGLLIDNQTTFMPDPKILEMVIQHRFGTMKNGFSDLFGIFAPGANIRLGLNYTVVKNLQIGYGLTKTNMTSDFQAKWTILEQTTSGRIPVALAVYGDLGLDGRNKDDLGIHYSFVNRFSYFAEIMISRKFTDWLSLQIHGNFTHFNLVDENYDHDRLGVGGIGRIKFTSQSSILLQFNAPLNISSMTQNTADDKLSKPNLGFGYEVTTGYHEFQIYILSSTAILPQYNYLYNINDFTKGDFLIGFTITRLWSF